MGERERLDDHRVAEQRFRWTDGDGVVTRVDVDDVAALAGGDAEAASLTDREAGDTVVTAELVTVDVDDRPG